MISSVTVEVQHQKQRDISQDSADIEKSESTSHYRTSGIALHKYTAMLPAGPAVVLCSLSSFSVF